ncbi:MAG: translation elongation factor 4 [Firmicutes bacterium]|nr:translation elongation factor 4 [Bacillota bacterium]
MQQKNIRNFSIIAHIDHGKSTLADRILEETGALTKREMQDQLLDSMDIERERGITIKLNAVQLKYNYNGEEYFLNLIDTPGHVDFTYEVSRSLAACEGAILVVDAAQGIEAQTIANLYLALENNLKIIPVINKIDLPNADPDRVKKELKDVLGFDEDEVILTSAKTGVGVKELIEAVIEKIPAPNGNPNDKLQALVFDSYYDSYKGVVALIKVVNGILKVGSNIKMMQTDKVYDVTELGNHTPKEKSINELKAGEVGYLSASIKSLSDLKVGDTITLASDPASNPLPGYKQLKPMVFCGLYPIETNKFADLREALEKLKLNDASLEFEVETSASLGFGFRCGFLGLLHMDVIIERIKREFNLDIIATTPSVIYRVTKTDKEVVIVDSPIQMPEKVKILKIEEPYVMTNIFVPSNYIGPIMELCQNKRGNYISMEYIDNTRVNIHYELPLSEIVYDFFDKLKSYTKGYASFDYELIGYRESDLVKMDVLLNGEIVDALSIIVHKDFAYNRGRSIVEKLRDLIPRQQFEVPIQASIGSKIIARSDIKAVRKDVLAKCYGGDVSRKRKLLEKQKEGKKRMKMVGSVEVPPEAFLAVLKLNDE